MEIKEKVFQTLKTNGEPLKSGEIAEMAGLDKKDVEKAIKQLVSENLVDSPKRCFYGLKNQIDLQLDVAIWDIKILNQVVIDYKFIDYEHFNHDLQVVILKLDVAKCDIKF